MGSGHLTQINDLAYPRHCVARLFQRGDAVPLIAGVDHRCLAQGMQAGSAVLSWRIAQRLKGKAKKLIVIGDAVLPLCQGRLHNRGDRIGHRGQRKHHTLAIRGKTHQCDRAPPVYLAEIRRLGACAGWSAS
jgi:hypothetical protein